MPDNPWVSGYRTDWRSAWRWGLLRVFVVPKLRDKLAMHATAMNAGLLVLTFVTCSSRGSPQRYPTRQTD